MMTRRIMGLALLALLLCGEAQAQGHLGPGGGLGAWGPTAKYTQMGDSLARPLWEVDFSNGCNGDFTTTYIASGALATGLPTSARLGVGTLVSSGSANGGAKCGTNVSALLLSGNEQAVIDVAPQTLTNSTARFGFCDTADHNDCVDGVYIECAATGVCTGKTANNSTRSSTGTTYTIVTTNWYRAVVTLGTGATSATFKLYNSAGTLVWSDSLATNIPVAAGRLVGVMAVATESGTGSLVMYNLDYIGFTVLQDLPRGAGGT
jgi:hypothetical protein